MLSITKADVHTVAPFSACLEHMTFEERLWELDLFSPNRRPCFCSQRPNGRARGSNLFSEVYSHRTGGNRYKLQHRKFQFNTREKFLPWEWSSTGTGSPERYLIIHPWRSSELHWKVSWASRCIWTCFEQQVGLDGLWSSFAIYWILWIFGISMYSRKVRV